MQTTVRTALENALTRILTPKEPFELLQVRVSARLDEGALMCVVLVEHRASERVWPTLQYRVHRRQRGPLLAR